VGKRAASCALFMSIFFDLSSFFMCDIDMFLLQTWLFPGLGDSKQVEQK
jgi:hypothetical protein